jgi:hypothetical protein
MSAVASRSVEERLAAMSELSWRWLFPLCTSLSHAVAMFSVDAAGTLDQGGRSDHVRVCRQLCLSPTISLHSAAKGGAGRA